MRGEKREKGYYRYFTISIYHEKLFYQTFFSKQFSYTCRTASQAEVKISYCTSQAELYQMRPCTNLTSQASLGHEQVGAVTKLGLEMIFSLLPSLIAKF